MTEYPVQCFEHNGEPYGRYANPYISPDGVYHPNSKFHDFETFAESNTFPFSSGTIGKTYERDEVEVVTEFKDGYLPEWKKTIVPGYHKDLDHPTRQAFYLVDKFIPKPVEKLAPELLWWENLSDEEAIQAQKNAGIYGHDQGVTHSDILEMWKDAQPVEKEPETVKDQTLIEINRLIGEISPCKPNFDHIADNGKINGTLLADIRSAMWKLLDWQKQQSK